MIRRPKQRQSPLNTMIALGQPDYRVVFLAFSFVVIENVGVLLFPLITRSLIDDLGANASPSLGRGGTAYLLAIVLLISALAGGAGRYLFASVACDAASRMKQRLVRTLIALPMSYFDGRESGSHVSHVTSDVQMISGFLTQGLSNLTSGVLLLAGSAIVLAALDARLFGVISGILILTFAVIAPIARRMKGIGSELSIENAGLSAALMRTFREIRLVKSASAEQFETMRHDRHVDALRLAGRRAAMMQAALQPVVSMALSSALVGVFLYGGSRVQSGALSVGTLTAFLLYVFNIAAPLVQISSFVVQSQAARGACREICTMLEEPSEIVQVDKLSTFLSERDDAQGEVQDLVLSRVKFSYGGALQNPIIIDSLHFPAGSSTALVGPSGSGKSSILALILRLYNPDQGVITYGGKSITDSSLIGWRTRLAYVSQDSPVVVGSIRENVLYGLQGPAEASRLQAALSSANCLDFIDRLPMGLDTQVGEGGAMLSGGQRQRIAIARAFMRDPEILLLDEPSSSLDAVSEEQVRIALERLRVGRTMILVSHREAMTIGCERVIHIDHDNLPRRNQIL